uniref:Enhancer of mRNA-decapping protein 4 n=1 Tax=Pavo cristatus TaxID=9049 RepID=A0A8C9F317_PAVCR
LQPPLDRRPSSSQPSSSYNGDLNGLLVPDPLVAGDGPSLAKPVHRSVSLGAVQEKQVICLSGDDSSTCVVISAKDVEIVASSDSSITSKARGSNKVKIQPVARYDWEQKYYYGNLIAVSNSYLAYAIRGEVPSRFCCFALKQASLHRNSPVLCFLTVVIREEILVNIKRPDGTPLNTSRRIIWCPFIPDDNEDNSEEGSQTLALLHEDRAEVWDLDIIRSNNRSWPVEVPNIKEGFIVVKGHSTYLSEGALSPDGTVLATASHDGFVKFWQIYIEGQDEPRCLHEWKPHDGRPLSCLLFCDNHKKQDPEVPFWRFLITGADQNRELKMWCTVSWTCLQTVRFSPDIFSSMSILPSLKVCLDLSAEYLILSDVQRKVLYVMELMQNQEEGKAYFSSISEFLLTHPVLSFGIQAVSRCRLRHTEVLPAEEENDNLSIEGAQGAGAVESAAGVLIKLFCVHTKALQDVQIRFQPLHSPDIGASVPSHGSHEEFGESDLGTEGLGSEKGSVHGSQPDLRRIADLPVPADFLSLSNDAKPKLMTPDAFMTPSTSLQQVIRGYPKMQLDTSLTLSSSSSSLQTSPRSHSVLIPGLPDKLTPKAPVPVRSKCCFFLLCGLYNLKLDWPSCSPALHFLLKVYSNYPRDEVEEKHKSSSYHRHSYHLLQHDSQDASAEQSDHDDEVASLASTSGGFGAKASTQRLPVKDWKAKASPRASPKLKRKGKKDDGYAGLARVQVAVGPQPVCVNEGKVAQSQQRELSDLRQNQMELLQRLTDHLDAIQSSLMGHMERVIDSQQEQEQRRLDRALTEGQQRNGQLQEHLSQQLSQTLSNAVCNRLERTVREEMKKTVPQCISKSMDPVAGQLSSTIATKLTAVEGTLKENITKLVKSKNLTDSVVRATADTLQGPIQSAYREAFQSVVLPAFEKSCQSMFQQINDTFKQGTQEYVQQLETHMKNKKAREQEARDPLLNQLRQLISTFQSTTEQLASTIAANIHAEVQHQLHIIVGNLQESILTQVQRVIKGEVSLAMKEQQAAVTSSIVQAMRSAAGTPIPSTHLDFQSQQTHILQLLQQGHLNQAFQQALTAADLNLVLYVCETVDTQQVFGQQPCPLSQPVLLSLIQQLSSDLGTRTELKLNYLEEAVMHLDHSDPITRDHMGSVMSQVRQKLFQFLQVEPHNTLSKPARRLMIMLQGLVTPGMT